MKKKIIISIMAVVMALSVLFALTACERTEVPTNGIRAGMTAGEIVEYLMKTEIKSFSSVMTKETSDGTISQYNYYTENGYCERAVTPAGETYTFQIVDGNRVVEIETGAGDSSVIITDLGNAKLSDGEMYNSGEYNSVFMPAYVFFGDLLQKNEYDVVGEGAIRYRIENGNLVFEVGDEGEFMVYDINKTTLPLPDEYKDYANMSATRNNGKFQKVTYETENGETVIGAEFSGVYYQVEEYAIPESVEIDGETLSVVYVSGYNFVADKVTLPKTIRKIYDISYIAPRNGGVYFDGTVQEWNANKVECENWYNARILHCKDGDVTVPDYQSAANGRYEEISFSTESGEEVTGASLTGFKYSSLEEYVIPESVEVGDKVLPVVQIDYVWADFSKKITLPKTIRKIYNIGNLTRDNKCEIWFDGTVEEWNANNVEFNTRYADGVKIHCSDGEVLAAGPRSGEGVYYRKVTFDTETGETVTGAELYGQYLEYYFPQKEYVIPESVEIDGETLAVVSIDGVNRIADKVTLPKTIRRVGNHFWITTAYMGPLYFDGTIAEWEANDVYFSSRSSDGIILHCTDGDIVVAKGE